jgi:hypothetical protein
VKRKYLALILISVLAIAGRVTFAADDPLPFEDGPAPGQGQGPVELDLPKTTTESGPGAVSTPSPDSPPTGIAPPLEPTPVATPSADYSHVEFLEKLQFSRTEFLPDSPFMTSGVLKSKVLK